MPEIRKILKANRVERAYLFGSACEMNFADSSDVDLLIRFSDSVDAEERGELWWNIYFSLEELLKRNVDLLTENSLTNPFFISEIEKKRIEIL